MKKTCLLSLVLWAGVTMMYRQWLMTVLEPPELWIVSCIVGLISLGGLSSIYNAWLAGRELKAVRRALSGEGPIDGRWSAAVGMVQPAERPLTAPFSGAPCVLYDFEITRPPRSSEHQPIVDFSGAAMIRCKIRTSTGDVYLSSFPDLENVPARYLTSERSIYDARRYVFETDWKDCTGFGVLSGVGDMLTTLTGSEESFRRDWRLIKPEECPWLTAPATGAAPMSDEELDQLSDDDDDDDDEDSDEDFDEDEADTVSGDFNAVEDQLLSTDYRPTLKEKRIEVGEKVVAVGKYEASTDSLVSTVAQGGAMLRMFLGDAEVVADQLAASRRRRFIGGVITLILANAALVGGLAVYRNSSATQRDWRPELSEAVKSGDAQKTRSLLERGADPNFGLSQASDSLLALAPNAEVAQALIDHGVDLRHMDQYGSTPLMHAARADRADVVQVIIDAGADMNFRNPQFGQTALVGADQRGAQAAAAVLRKAGALDDRATAENGQAVTDADPTFEVVRRYLAAVHAEDPELLQALSSMKFDFTTVDWAVWKPGRPKEPILISGFVRGDDATLMVTGAGLIWGYQLRRENDRWLVAREWMAQ